MICDFRGSTCTISTTTTMSSLFDDVDQKCNELMEKAVSATRLKVDLQVDLSINVGLTEGDDFVPNVIFPVATPDKAPEIHRRVFVALARIINTHGVPKVSKLGFRLPSGVHG